MSMKKAQPAKIPAKAATKAVAKAATKAVAKVTTKAVATVPAKAKAPAKVAAKAPAKKNSREAMLARVEAVRLTQRNEGHFDCFGRAGEGYCDQGECAYHAECISVSRMLHSM
jgi:hypothetical protein